MPGNGQRDDPAGSFCFGVPSAGVSDKHRATSDLWLPLIEPFSLVAAEPEKGFSLHVPPNFELLVLRNFQMLSSLADFLKPTFRE
jgi:hypothetical protein